MKIRVYLQNSLSVKIKNYNSENIFVLPFFSAHHVHFMQTFKKIFEIIELRPLRFAISHFRVLRVIYNIMYNKTKNKKTKTKRFFFQRLTVKRVQWRRNLMLNKSKILFWKIFFFFWNILLRQYKIIFFSVSNFF